MSFSKVTQSLITFVISGRLIIIIISIMKIILFLSQSEVGPPVAVVSFPTSMRYKKLLSSTVLYHDWYHSGHNQQKYLYRVTIFYIYIKANTYIHAIIELITLTFIRFISYVMDFP